ncbi:MAG: hypothetical protein A2Y12_14095 [Planctomycetes bacterium GWF2_42_9]|nr:MAG: hypothetical protein A2Y12_14095 [Planctomycetes bacterium GWF2_42_9]
MPIVQDERFLLNDDWLLRQEPLYSDASSYFQIKNKTQGWMACSLPTDVYQVLISKDQIQEPLVGLNSFSCKWIEDCTWWFKKIFRMPQDFSNVNRLKLVLNNLDMNAAIFFNDILIGKHGSAFYPFTFDVTKYIKFNNNNSIYICLTSGLESVSGKQLSELKTLTCTEEINGRPERGDIRRPYLRKPQYVFGWDWCPRVSSVAIGGEAYIESTVCAKIKDVFVQTVKTESEQIVLTFRITLDLLKEYSTVRAEVSIKLTDPESNILSKSQKVMLRPGLNYIDLQIPVENPLFWWPNGMGLQSLYTIEAHASSEDFAVAYPAFKYGIRSIVFDNDEFCFKVNGNKIFCKGANWVPPDALYSRVTKESIEELLTNAKNANFNMLRVWGGGVYPDDYFYDCCDRLGILLWHDFMFACAPYPDHVGSFMDHVSAEADYQTRRLRNRACMALWCGGNECSWMISELLKPHSDRGYDIINYLLPKVVNENTNTAYWNNSPFGGLTANDENVGNHHLWHNCMMHPDVDVRINPDQYKKCRAKFITEFGYIGAPVLESVLEYSGNKNVCIDDKIWKHHTNTFEKETVLAGIKKYYHEPESLDEYILYSGLVQGLMLQGALESFRIRQSCNGALFWMYNDCWGEVGWSIIDYFKRRKPSWYFVKRAFAPVKLVIQRSEEAISVTFINDSPTKFNELIEIAFLDSNQNINTIQKVPVNISPFERIQIYQAQLNMKTQNILFARSLNLSQIEPAIHFINEPRNVHLPKAVFKMHLISEESGNYTLTISSNSFAHAVELELPAQAVPSDNYFDLIANTEKVIQVKMSSMLDVRDIKVTSFNNS